MSKKRRLCGPGTAELVNVALEQTYAEARTERAATLHLSFTFIFPDKKRYCITRPGKVTKLLKIL